MEDSVKAVREYAPVLMGIVLGNDEIVTEEQYFAALGLLAELEEEEMSGFTSLGEMTDEEIDGLGDSLGALKAAKAALKKKSAIWNKKKLIAKSRGTLLRKLNNIPRGLISPGTQAMIQLQPHSALLLEKMRGLDRVYQSAYNNLMSKKWKLIPHTFYSIMSTSGQQMVELCADGTKAKQVITNFADGKMQSDAFFLPLFIRVTSVTGTTINVDETNSLIFGSPNAAFFNGEWSFNVDGKTFVERSYGSEFDRDISVSNGLRRWEIENPNPQIILPQKNMRFSVFAAQTLPLFSFMRLELRGLLTTNA